MSATADNRSNYVVSFCCCLLFSLFLFCLFVPQQCAASVRSNDFDVLANTGGDTSQSDGNHQFLMTMTSNDYCNANIECGFESNSVCYNGTCICQLGYQWNSTVYKCKQQRCTKDNECAELFPNTVCDTNTLVKGVQPVHYCVCPRTHIYSKVDEKCIAREDHHYSRPSNLQTFLFIAGGIVILLVLVAGGCSGGRWFYLHYRPPSSSSRNVVTASSMTVNENSPSSSLTPYPPYLNTADHQFSVEPNNNSHHQHLQQLANAPYSRSPSGIQ